MDEIPYRLPLVIGVTGHRDLRDEDIPQLEQAVTGVIRRLKHDYLSGPRRLCRVWGLRRVCHRLGLDVEVPIIVLSSLAEGADRLVARVAMKHGAKLIAPLPLPIEEYRRDFAPGLKTDAASGFDDLMQAASGEWQVPFAAGNSIDAVRTDEKKRDLQYREVGLFIVRHCHVLIALWDGDARNASVGGTAQVVGYKRNGIPLDVTGPARASLDAPEIGPVIHIVTPRAKSAEAAPPIAVNPWGRDVIRRYRGGWIRRGWRHVAKFFVSLAGSEYPDDRSSLSDDDKKKLDPWEVFAAQVRLTRRFNRSGARLARSGEGPQELDKSLRDLFHDEQTPSDDARGRATKLLPHWCAAYRTADALAARWQRYFRFDWTFLFLLGFLGIACFEVTTHLVFDQHQLYWLLGAYSGLFLIVFAWFILARWRQHQERFLDYRALAEALRVAVFWKLVGIDWRSDAVATDLSSGNSVASAYPIRQPRELDWVKTCLRTLELLDVEKSSDAVNHSGETDGHPWARAFWVQGQLAFFHSRVRRHDHSAEVLENRSIALLFVSITLAAILCMFDFDMFGVPHWDHAQPRHRIVIFLIGVLPGLAAVSAGFAERLAHKAQARQYDRMYALFERAHDLLQASPAVKFRQIQALYAELGAEAMKETAEWVAIYRQRPLRPP
jgi:hypothetical protein